MGICGCYGTHSTHTNEATAMGNVKVDYDVQLERTKKEMNYNVSSHIRTSFTSLVCLFVIVFSSEAILLVQKFMKIDEWSQLTLFCYSCSTFKNPTTTIRKLKITTEYFYFEL